MKFADALSNAKAEAARQGLKSGEHPYIKNGTRLKEANQVNDLVQRFATAEVDGQPIGRTATAAIRKPLGAQLKRALADANRSTVETVRDAIMDSVAIGYLVALGLDAANKTKVDRSRTIDQIWSFWIPCIYTGYLRDASKTPPSDVQGAELLGAAMLEGALRDLDLGRSAKGRKITAIGAGYGKAGLVLRMGQSTLTPGDWVTDPPADFLVTYANLWDRKDYPP